jgi:hypothetical protein
MRRLGGRAPLLTGPEPDGPGARRRNRRGDTPSCRECTLPVITFTAPVCKA